jgi:hypothetical protein
VLSSQELSSLYTIDELFSLIQQAINSDTSVVLDVVYNAEFGYPEKVSIDWLVGAVDDEMTYLVSGFQ